MGMRGKSADGDTEPADQEVVEAGTAPTSIAGYRPITDVMKTLVNENKELEEVVLRRLDALAAMPAGTLDPRWYAIGRTKIEEAFMAINRAVMQPTRIDLPGDSWAA